MRQVLYISDSLIGGDALALDRLMVQARNNNALDGVTGLLWTDGRRFAQVIEGSPTAIEELLAKLRADPRHANIEITRDVAIAEREFGEWSMNRPATDGLADVYEKRMIRQLSRVTGALDAAFAQIIAGSRPAAAS